ncbi:uncharacterized protein TNCV_707741 [Trichonephila clavipes]|nr:uncharacterized protein TNCV_707741 [Trichonephila clavipes]
MIKICCYTNAHLIDGNIRSRPRSSSWQGASLTPVVNCSFEHHTGDSTIWLGSALILRENTWGWSGDSQLSTPSTNFTRDLWFDGYLEYPHAEKALYIHKHPCLLRDSNPVPYSTVVSAINLYTGWVACKNINNMIEEQSHTTFYLPGCGKDISQIVGIRLLIN